MKGINLSERGNQMDNGASSYRRFLDGDDKGLVDIIRDYKDGLILFLNGFADNINVAEELAEDTFVKIGIKKPYFAGKSSFKTWLYAIGRNVAINKIKKYSKIEQVPIDESSEEADIMSLEHDYIREERKIVIRKAMKNLNNDYRQVLWLIYFEGLSNKETASVMGKTIHNIETIVYRARQSLKSELIKEGFNYENL